MKKRRSKVDPEIWKNVFPEDVEELPFNIERTCVFCLNFQKDQRMKSTKHSRPWNAWVTTNWVTTWVTTRSEKKNHM